MYDFIPTGEVAITQGRSLSYLLSNNSAAFTLLAVQVEPEHTIGKKAGFV
jgi:hypothetical protein